jgi:uncharacterized membrane protein
VSTLTPSASASSRFVAANARYAVGLTGSMDLTARGILCNDVGRIDRGTNQPGYDPFDAGENDMFGLTPLGIAHTVVSLVAIVCGLRALARDKEISPKNALGLTYVVATALAAGSALGIFQHGGFNIAHALAIITLAALLIGTLAAFTGLFGSAGRYIQATAYSATFLFSLIPAVTETLTRLPPGKPFLPSALAPEFKMIHGTMFVIFLVLLVLQLRWLRRNPARTALPVGRGAGGQ